MTKCKQDTVCIFNGITSISSLALIWFEGFLKDASWCRVDSFLCLFHSSHIDKLDFSNCTVLKQDKVIPLGNSKCWDLKLRSYAFSCTEILSNLILKWKRFLLSIIIMTFSTDLYSPYYPSFLWLVDIEGLAHGAPIRKEFTQKWLLPHPW